LMKIKLEKEVKRNMLSPKQGEGSQILPLLHVQDRQNDKMKKFKPVGPKRHDVSYPIRLLSLAHFL
jgi:hypothetical protein